MLSNRAMTALASALLAIARVLGVWCAASVVSFPILVLCVRTQARANARITRELRREEWSAAARR